MEEQQTKEATRVEPPNTDNVVPFAARTSVAYKEPPATPEELAEYRRLKPRLLAMLAEWDRLKNQQTGCPVMAQILSGDP